MLMMASFIMVKTARDALFISQNSIEALPQAYLGIAALALPVAFLSLGSMRLMGARRGRVAVPLLAAGALALLAPPASVGTGGVRPMAFFVFVPLVYGVLFSIGWLLAGRILEGALYDVQLRAFQWIGASTILGGALGGLAGRALATRLEPHGLLAAGCGLLVASAAVMAWTQLRFPMPGGPSELPAVVTMEGAAGLAAGEIPGPTEEPVVREGTSFSRAWNEAARDARRVVAQGYVRKLAAIAMAAACAGVLVEFLFYRISAASPRSVTGNAEFFAGAYLFMHAGAFLVQVFLYSPIQRRFGISGTLMAMPLVLVGGSVSMLAGAAMAVGQALRIAEGGLKQSVHRSSWEQAFLPLHAGDRGLAKLIVDGAGARMAEGGTAALLMVWIRFRASHGGPSMPEFTPILAALLVASLAWFGLTRSMRRQVIRHARAFPEDRCRPDSPLPDG